MAYFLKKSNLKKGTYLQIYESFYDPERRGSAHRSYKALGYVQDLMARGIADPIAFYKEEVAKLNQQFAAERNKDKARQITEEPPETFLGYFPIKSINEQLGVKPYLDLMQTAVDVRFNIFDTMASLIYARVVAPCSKSKTFEDVLPRMREPRNFSLNQLYSGLEYIGAEYEKIMEIYNHQVSRRYPLDTSHTYFDCTNFYFEIDQEDELRRKGPSKENRKEPIVGMGLLLDAHQTPIGMKLFPGNESEKPIVRSVVDDLKSRNNLSGKTIQVADKGLNCAENILHAVTSGDGYIFSKSVKTLPQTEQAWILLQQDYQDVTDAKGKLLYRIKECVDEFPYSHIHAQGKKTTVRLKEKRVATFNPQLAKKQTLEIKKQAEKAKTLKASQAKKSEYGDSAKYVTFLPTDQEGRETNGNIKVTINEKAIEKALALAGYNLLVTSETQMSASAIYSAYHNLWRIEESFRIMKSQLDARPVYLQKKETITGHFLICYLAVLLTRLLQFKVLEDTYCSEDILGFMKQFKAVKISDRKYINLTKNSAFIQDFSKKTGLPLTSYFLSQGDIKKMLSHKF